MTMYVYHAEGHPVGFLFGTFIHDLDQGEPLGRVLGSHVYRLDGIYVGEFYKDMVVAKPVLARVRNIQPMNAPPPVPVPGAGFPRRVLMNYGYADAFHQLFHPLQEATELAIAAE